LVRHLIIDTATEALSVALFDGGELIGHHHEIAGRGHAEKLVPAIAALPEGGRADAIRVDAGPGSFTGIRVGIAAARALAFAWDARLSSYSSLHLLAAMARRECTAATQPIAIALTGGHGELFWQQFDPRTLAPLAPSASIPIADLARAADAPVVYGTGAPTLIAARGHGEAHLLHPDARCAMLLPEAFVEEGVTTRYGRGADAVPAGERR
jgi:tRNA threonylcarbamoyladenosine biosynthesis protein TsaB